MNKPIVVIDVGCRWGFAEPFIRDIEYFELYGFDPDQEECERLNAHYSSSQIKAVPVALGQTEEEKVLYLTRDPACSSLYKPDPYYTSRYAAFDCEVEVGTSLVKVARLDSWAKENNVNSVDFLKVDTQGSELDVLKGCGALLQGMRAIEVEVEFNPMYLGQPIFSEVDLFLRSQGFVLWKLSEITHYSKNKQASPPIGLVDVRYDDWNSETVGVFAGQLFWANAHYVSKNVLQDDISTLDRERDEVLFSALGMPDVLGDQQQWSAAVAEKSQDSIKHATYKVGELDCYKKEVEKLERLQVKTAQEEAEATAKVRQLEAELEAVYQSNSWRFTSLLRWLGHRIKKP